MQAYLPTQLMIESIYSDLTKAEKKLADLVLNNIDDVLNKSITEFSEKADVGDSTVVRFCRKLGFMGYQGFRVGLVKEAALAENNGSILATEEIMNDDSVDEIANKIAISYEKAISDTRNLLNADEVYEIAAKILAAERVSLYGHVYSGLSAENAKFKLHRIGINAECDVDGHSMAISACLLKPGDVAVGISHSGSSKDVVRALEIAREAGATTLAITHYMKSPISRFSDHILLTAAKETPFRSGSLAQTICQSYVIDVLYTEILRQSGDEGLEILNRAIKAIEEKLY